MYLRCYYWWISSIPCFLPVVFMLQNTALAIWSKPKPCLCSANSRQKVIKMRQLANEAKFALSHESQRCNRHLRKDSSALNALRMLPNEIQICMLPCSFYLLCVTAQRDLQADALPSFAKSCCRTAPGGEMQWHHARDILWCSWTDGSHPEAHHLGGSMSVSLTLCGASPNMSILLCILYPVGMETRDVVEFHGTSQSFPGQEDSWGVSDSTCPNTPNSRLRQLTGRQKNWAVKGTAFEVIRCPWRK